MPPKRKCKFNNKLGREFPFIKSTELGECDVRCNKCSATFSIANGGRSSIVQHISSEKHKRVDMSATSSKPLSSIFKNKVFNDREKNLALKEAVWAFHTIQHSFSFRSNDCTSKIIKKCFDEAYSCARTKTEAIICNVFVHLLTDSIKTDLSKVNFITIFSDCSNHGSTKLCSILVRYFLPGCGVKIKVLSVVSIQNENSDTITNCIINIIEKYDMFEKLLALCADNTNCNFGGALRSGQNNVFSKLQKATNRKLIGVNCAAHVLNNCIQTAADCLPVDIELVLIKIYSYFYIYTIRVEELKEICENIDIQYRKLLSFSKTRWLTLFPSLERILKLFQPLKLYFAKQTKCPIIIKSLFENPLAEQWMHFIHCQAVMFHKYISKIESQDISMCEASISLKEIKSNIEERKNELFVPLIVKQNIEKLVKEKCDTNIEIEFYSAVRVFYETCIDYLNKWDKSFEDIAAFEWILLRKPPLWSQIQDCLPVVLEISKITINESELFDETCFLKNYVTIEKINYWKNKEITLSEKWVEIFYFFNEKNISTKNISKLVQFFLCLPASNAPTERVFSIINNIWTSEKTQFNVETIEACVKVKCNFDMNCTEFYEYLKSKESILKKVHSSEKYKSY